MVDNFRNAESFKYYGIKQNKMLLMMKFVGELRKNNYPNASSFQKESKRNGFLLFYFSFFLERKVNSPCNKSVIFYNTAFSNYQSMFSTQQFFIRTKIYFLYILLLTFCFFTL